MNIAYLLRYSTITIVQSGSCCTFPPDTARAAAQGGAAQHGVGLSRPAGHLNLVFAAVGSERAWRGVNRCWIDVHCLSAQYPSAERVQHLNVSFARRQHFQELMTQSFLASFGDTRQISSECSKRDRRVPALRARVRVQLAVPVTVPVAVVDAHDEARQSGARDGVQDLKKWSTRQSGAPPI